MELLAEIIKTIAGFLDIFFCAWAGQGSTQRVLQGQPHHIVKKEMQQKHSISSKAVIKVFRCVSEYLCFVTSEAIKL